MKIKKRAQGHVEIILSFTLFVGFVIFILIFINPLSRNVEKTTDINSIEKELIKNISINVDYFSVIVGPIDGCYKVNVPSGKKITEVIDTNNARRYFIYFSDSLNERTGHNNQLCLTEYKTSAIIKEDLIFHDFVTLLKQKYESDYNELKKNLKLNNDFYLIIKDKEGNEISELSMKKETPKGLEREVKEYPIIVIDNNGNKQEFIINIGVW